MNNTWTPFIWFCYKWVTMEEIRLPWFCFINTKTLITCHLWGTQVVTSSEYLYFLAYIYMADIYMACNVDSLSKITLFPKYVCFCAILQQIHLEILFLSGDKSSKEQLHFTFPTYSRSSHENKYQPFATYMFVMP